VGREKESGRSKCPDVISGIGSKHGSTRELKGNSPGESVLTSGKCLIAREPGEPLKMGKQKTAIRAGALVDDAKKWKAIDWKQARRQIRRLQVRIAKAVKERMAASQ